MAMVTISRFLSVVSIAAIGLTGGCAVKQPPPADDALATMLPPATVVPDAWKAGTGLPGPAVMEWLQTFGDPQLELLVDEALRNNLDLQAAAARVEIAAGLIAQARSLLFPHIVAVGGVGAVGRDTTRDRSGLAG